MAGVGVDPAGIDPTVEAVGGLRIDAAGVQNQAPERSLNVVAGAAETVIEVEVAKRGFEVVAPQQAHHSSAEPHAFWIAGRTADLLLGLGILIDLGRFLGGFLTVGRSLVGGFSRSFSTTAMITSSRYVSTRTIGT